MNSKLHEDITIRPIEVLNPDDIRRLNVGYTSPAKYVIAKDESTDRIIFSLELVRLEQPYVKRWETDEKELAQLTRIVEAGYTLGAYHGEQMIGITIAEPRNWNRSLWVWEFHIAADYQRGGIGRQLMEALVRRAKDGGMRVLVCETQNTNVPAIRFYRSVGYEIDGIDLSYYTNEDVIQGEVALFMKRKIE